MRTHQPNARSAPPPRWRRLALQHGAPLVPVFAFGQTDLYSYLRPFYDWPKGVVLRASWARFSRRIGFVPMLMW